MAEANDDDNERYSTNPEKKRVNLMVGKKQKARWKEYAANSEHGTLTTLIRKAVEEEMKDKSDDNSTPSTEATLDPDALDPITESLDRIERSQRQLIERVENLESSAKSKDDIQALSTMIMEILPKRSKLPGDPQDHALSVDDVVRNLDYDIRRIDARQALARLDSQISQVQSAEIGEEKRWWVR